MSTTEFLPLMEYPAANPKVCLIMAPRSYDWDYVKYAAMFTMGRTEHQWYHVTSEWKADILRAKHSPIRMLNFLVEFIDIPYCNAMHLVRHVHAVPFCQSQRPDHQSKKSALYDIDGIEPGFDRSDLSQTNPINLLMYMNAEELQTICEKRMCGKADDVTREYVTCMAKVVEMWEPAFKGLLGPTCAKYGYCNEMQPCGQAVKI